jgi:hypothetical protein
MPFISPSGMKSSVLSISSGCTLIHRP